jgi:hypothetical protein
MRDVWGLRLGVPLAHGLDPAGGAPQPARGADGERNRWNADHPAGRGRGHADRPSAAGGSAVLSTPTPSTVRPSTTSACSWRRRPGPLPVHLHRKGANGPTLGDVRGASLLDGPGLYARSFRSARRL